LSNPKVKIDQYVNVGGIQQKVSTYATNEKNVLELENYDFQVPGAWRKRWGFTSAAVNTTLTLGGRPVVGMITSFNNQQGINNLVFTDQRPYIYTYDASTKSGPGYSGMTNGTFNYIVKGSSPLYSGTTILQVAARNFNYMTFWTTGATIYKFYADPLTANTSTPGTTNCKAGVYALQAPIQAPPAGSGYTATGSGSFTGVYQYRIGFRDLFGYLVPGVRPFSGGFGPVSSLAGSTVTSTGQAQITLFGLPTPAITNAHAATSLVLYRNRVTGYPEDDIVSIGEIAVGGTTTFVDSSLAGGNLVGYPVPTHQNFPSTVIVAPDVSVSAECRYLEVYANRLWIASKRLGKLYFSEILSPETVEPESNIDIVGNETDIMGLKAYNQTLIIGMRKGVFRLTGDSPENFNLLELTKEYGWVSNNAAVEWHERLWFLDRQTIVEFNGSNFRVVSDPIQPTMQTIDYETAEERASGIHVQSRNEVWFSVPISGTDFNRILVYDYSMDAWTTFKGVAATALAQLYTQDAATISSGLKTERNPRVFFGTPGGTLNFFDTSFLTDAGNSITCAFKSKYHMSFPKTATAQFRRLYIDPGPGATGLTFAIQWFKDYATLTPSLTRAVNVTSFQQRIEYGIPAKSLSVRVDHASGATTHVLYGYGIESRFQRNV